MVDVWYMLPTVTNPLIVVVVSPLMFFHVSVRIPSFETLPFNSMSFTPRLIPHSSNSLPLVTIVKLQLSSSNLAKLRYALYVIPPISIVCGSSTLMTATPPSSK